MRSYATVSSRFWSGETGRKLKAKGRDAQLLAAYLITNKLSNMIGLYDLPLAMVMHDLSMTMEEAQRTMVDVQDTGFCQYDFAESLVYVPEMARHQIAESLSTADKRHRHVVTQLQNFAHHGFAQAFVEHYDARFKLGKHVRLASPLISPLLSPFEGVSGADHDSEPGAKVDFGHSRGVSKPLRSQDQDQDQDQDQRSTSPNPPQGGNGHDDNGQVQEVFDHWRTVMKHPGAMLEEKRTKVIRKALKRHPVADLKRAIDGCRASRWHMGENDRRKVFDSLGLILRDAEHIEDFMRTAEHPQKGSDPTQRTFQDACDYEEE